MTDTAFAPGEQIGGGGAAAKAKNIITPKFRVSFAFVFRTNKPMKLGAEPKYSVAMLFEKGADLSALYTAVRDLVVEKFGPDKTRWPKLKNPFRDQKEKEGHEGYVPGAVFITATSKNRPGLVDHNVQPIINEADFYSGCYAMASVRPFYYKESGNEGISFGLQNIQKLADGPPLAGRAKPEDDFKPIAPELAAGAPMSIDAIFGG